MTNRAAIFKGEGKFEVVHREISSPLPHEVQIDVAYCGICGTDIHIYHGHMDERVGFNRTIGHEMSGVISEIGEAVSNLSVGQKVVVRPLVNCNDCYACRSGHSHICSNLKFLGIDADGAFQEKWNAPANTVHVLPDHMDLSVAALVEPLAVACHDVARGGVKAGENILVIGGGPIGLLIATVAKQRGANVIVAEVDKFRIEYARKSGFDTINPEVTDALSVIMKLTQGQGADVTFEVSGTQAGVDLMTALAAVKGRIVMVSIHTTTPKVDLFQFFWRELEMLGARVYTSKDYDTAIQLLSGGLIDPENFITNYWNLEEIQQAFDSTKTENGHIKTMISMTT